MTKREYLQAVITMAVSAGKEDVAEMAKVELASLDRKNSKAKEARLKQAEAEKPLYDGFLAYCGSHKKALASELASVLGVSTSKVVAIGAKLVESGAIKVDKVKITKVGERNAYSLAEQSNPMPTYSH